MWTNVSPYLRDRLVGMLGESRGTEGAWSAGLTLVLFSLQREHFLWDTLGGFSSV
jgi:hypothetical protein